MFARIFASLVVVSLVITMGSLSFVSARDADHPHQEADHPQQSEHPGQAAADADIPGQETEAVDAGNKICPVMGHEIDPETKGTYEYQGKIYNLCCAGGCLDAFEADPQKYIKKVEEELGKKEKGSN